MIIFNVKQMNETLQNELFEICQVHGKVVKENYGNEFPVLNDLIVIMNQILELKEEETIYNEIKQNVVEEDDVEKVRQ